VSATLSPSNAEIPSAEPFRSLETPTAAREAHLHAALPQKASEKYGFVVYVGSLIAWYLFLFWSFTPDRYIKALGIEWYPDRCVMAVSSMDT
jgi:phosphatidylinositol glycan class P protein